MEENTAGGQGTARGDPQASRWYRGWGTILHQASILQSTPSSVLLRGTKPCLAQPWSTLWFPTGHEAASVTVKCNGFAPALGSLCWAGWSSDGTLQQCQCCSRLCPNRAPPATRAIAVLPTFTISYFSPCEPLGCVTLGGCQSPIDRHAATN